MADSTDNGSSLAQILVQANAAPGSGFDEFAALATAVQLDRSERGVSDTKLVSRSTALWAILELDDEISDALEEVRLKKSGLSRQLSVGKDVTPSTTVDAQVHDDFAEGLRSYLERNPDRRTVDLVDLAIAIFESIPTGESTVLPGRMSELGVSVDKAIQVLRELLESDDGETSFHLSDFSGSVQDVRARLAPIEQVSASGIAEEIRSSHSDYAAGALIQARFDPDLGVRKPFDDWLASVSSLYEHDKVAQSRHKVIDGRLMLLGLAVLDAAFEDQIKSGDLLDPLREEVEVLPKTPRRAPSLEMLADVPVDDEDHDALNFGPYVSALAELIDSPSTSTPLTIAVNGAWGSGKTSFARMLERKLIVRAEHYGRQPPLFVWFNAWLHDDAPDLGAALAARVGAVAGRHRRLLTRLAHPLPKQMLNPSERFRRRLIVSVLGLAVTAALVLLFRGALDPNEQIGENLVGNYGAGLGSALALLWVLILGWSQFFGAARTAGRFLTSPKAEAGLGALIDVRRELGLLIADAIRGNRRLIVIVDDLERCEPPRSVEVCEVANQLLDHPGVVVVYLADMQAIATSVEIKYGDLAAREGEQLGVSGSENENLPRGAWGRAYMQKIVQFQMDVPIPDAKSGPAMLQRFQQIAAEPRRDWDRQRTSSWADRITAFARRSIRRQNREDADRAEEVANNLVKDSSLTPSELERRLTEEVGGADPLLIGQVIQRALTGESELKALADEVVLRYIPPNPRNIKRFSNRLRFQFAMAVRLGLLEENPDRMAKLTGKWSVLLELWPELSQAIRDGRVTVKELETAAKEDKQAADRAAVEQAASSDAKRRASTNIENVLAGAGVHLPATDEMREFLASEPLFEKTIDEFLYHDVLASGTAIMSTEGTQVALQSSPT